MAYGASGIDYARPTILSRRPGSHPCNVWFDHHRPHLDQTGGEIQMDIGERAMKQIIRFLIRKFLPGFHLSKNPTRTKRTVTVQTDEGKRDVEYDQVAD